MKRRDRPTKTLAVRSKSRRTPGVKYDEEVRFNIMLSTLERPEYPQISSCMTLTIVIYYTLNFADRRTKATRDDITDWNGKIHYAIDSNGDWFE
ncbi:MAG: hypothetical protein H7070_17025, partial [Saprospiraceae bacterium]|nr:hypothetical protein [Pyrinomonadaceae bacterium]